MAPSRSFFIRNSDETNVSLVYWLIVFIAFIHNWHIFDPMQMVLHFVILIHLLFKLCIQR